MDELVEGEGRDHLVDVLGEGRAVQLERIWLNEVSKPCRGRPEGVQHRGKALDTAYHPMWGELGSRVKWVGVLFYARQMVLSPWTDHQAAEFSGKSPRSIKKRAFSHVRTIKRKEMGRCNFGARGLGKTSGTNIRWELCHMTTCLSRQVTTTHDINYTKLDELRETKLELKIDLERK